MEGGTGVGFSVECCGHNIFPAFCKETVWDIPIYPMNGVWLMVCLWVHIIMLSGFARAECDPDSVSSKP